MLVSNNSLNKKKEISIFFLRIFDINNVSWVSVSLAIDGEWCLQEQKNRGTIKWKHGLVLDKVIKYMTARGLGSAAT